LERNDLQLLRKLGSGHFGVVWYGLWKGQIEVAVKTMKPGSTSTDSFLKEASIMKKFRHDRVVTLYGVCTREEPIFIVTEYMCKGSLLDLLRSPDGRNLTFEQLLYITSQVNNFTTIFCKALPPNCLTSDL
jgi:tyrosine-protein kinase Src